MQDFRIYREFVQKENGKCSQTGIFFRFCIKIQKADKLITTNYAERKRGAKDDKTQADFYAGENFIFAASIEDDTVRASEFLGNISALPGIVCALGCTEGIFRVPGEDRPFAMYFPLEENHKKPPAYFGFAFD